MKSTAWWLGFLGALVLALAWKVHVQQERIEWLTAMVKELSISVRPR
jgi:hypothetical protein